MGLWGERDPCDRELETKAGSGRRVEEVGELGAGAGRPSARHLDRPRTGGWFCGQCGLEELGVAGPSPGPCLARSRVGWVGL